MILKQYTLTCDKCGKVIDTYYHYKPSNEYEKMRELFA